jgi:cytochrome c-type biogenesis protein CcmF
MLPELGHLAVLVAFSLALAQAVVPTLGVQGGSAPLMRSAPGFAIGQLVFVTAAFAVLTAAFLGNDFSVTYVAQNSNTTLPWYYRVSAVWGSHEGSFLLWCVVTAGWSTAVAVGTRKLPLDVQARVLAVLGAVAACFLSFLLFASNPFERSLPLVPRDGADLNPQLQDFGLIVHPPMLYVGYIGFAVAYAFAVAALWSGRVDGAWARWSRPWTAAAWAFLSIGIALGSWWAYYELGWGGWWFWDAVENASFMPWLVGTALLHSLAATEKRGVFRVWTVLLAIGAFGLSLLGAFIVRSGVLTSVHAFAVDPERGLYLLVLLVLIVGGALALFAARAPQFPVPVRFATVSREVGLGINNLLLIVSTVVVALGTLAPLVWEAATGGKISVGKPYFDAWFVPLMAVLSLFMGAGALAAWKRDRASRLARLLWPVALVAVVGGVLTALGLGGPGAVGMGLAVTLAVWIVGGLARDLVQRFRSGTGIPSAGYAGMVLAHFGFAVALLGAVGASLLATEKDLRVEVGQTVEVGGRTLRFDSVRQVLGPNYLAQRGQFTVLGADGAPAFQLHPEKRRYAVRGNVMTEAAIRPGFWRDLYVALGEPLPVQPGAPAAWAVRVHGKPLVRWIWGGAGLMALGGFVALADRRYRTRRAPDPVTAPAPPERPGAPAPAGAVAAGSANP